MLKTLSAIKCDGGMRVCILDTNLKVVMNQKNDMRMEDMARVIISLDTDNTHLTQSLESSNAYISQIEDELRTLRAEGKAKDIELDNISRRASGLEAQLIHERAENLTFRNIPHVNNSEADALRVENGNLIRHIRELMLSIEALGTGAGTHG